ncbi:MAG: CapA family protein, partial [Lachnospiraceae bacterium]|nr:CapA family protein [Lachnospiraceae bacterium]
LANNHALDRGRYGIEVTSDFFESAAAKSPGDGPRCLGVNRGRCGIASENEINRGCYEIVSKNGIRVALFNYTYGLNGLDLSDSSKFEESAVNILPPLSDNPAYEELISDIGEARGRADFVIFFVHWGEEYETKPNEFQTKWAKVFLESQVDVLIGTHPHVVQPCEFIKDEKGHEMLVFYSLGNLISTQKGEECRLGIIADFTLVKEPDGSCHIGQHDSHRINSSFWGKISGAE